jgi:hypothetical protein
MHVADQGLDYINDFRGALKAVAASQTYRHYSLLNLLQSTYPTNKAGNFRGMVIGGRWKTIFHFVSEHGEALENVGTFAAFGANLADMAHQFNAVYHSTDNDWIKGLRYSAMAGTAAERALAGAVTGGVHLTYMSLQGYCMMAGLLGGSARSAANSCINTLNTADVFVQTSVKMITDTGHQAETLYHPAEAAKAAYKWVVNMEFLKRQ